MATQIGRLRWLFVALGVLVLAAGTVAYLARARSPEAAPAAGDHSFTIEWQGEQRTYHVHAPPTYDPGTALPLVVTMHYYPGSAAEVETLTGMSRMADREGFLVLYPEGVDGGFNALVCCGDADDVGLIKTLVARMVTTWHADPTRVYATGISNGADMSYRLAVELPGTFAAIAPVSGGFGGAKVADPNYRPSTPVSVITFIGGLDPYHAVFVAGIERWLNINQCEPNSTGDSALPNHIAVAAYSCVDGSNVVTYDLPQMGHSWPGAAQGALADSTAGISATELIWQFFSEHRLTIG